MSKISNLILFAVFLVCSAEALANKVVHLSYQGDAVRGKLKSSACVACHNADGNSTNAVWPKIASLGRRYFIAQMQQFKLNDKGCRANAIMYPIAKDLSDEDIADLAAYFDSQSMTIGVAKADHARGEQLYRAGDRNTGVPACMACHGPAGNGMNQAGYPRMGGQNAPYLVAQLKAFASGARCNDAGKMMRMISKRLSEADMQAVADYMQGLHS